MINISLRNAYEWPVFEDEWALAILEFYLQRLSNWLFAEHSIRLLVWGTLPYTTLCETPADTE